METQQKGGNSMDFVITVGDMMLLLETGVAMDGNETVLEKYRKSFAQ